MDVEACVAVHDCVGACVCERERVLRELAFAADGGRCDVVARQSSEPTVSVARSEEIGGDGAR